MSDSNDVLVKGVLRRWSVALFAFLFVISAFSVWFPGILAQPYDMWLEESPFTGSDTLFVPGENITIHVEGPEDDIYVLKLVYDPWGVPAEKRVWPPRTVPASEELIYEYQIPMSASSVEAYQIEVWDETETIHYWIVDYVYYVTLFDADIEVGRNSYIAGEEVDIHYMCWYSKDHSPVSTAHIDWLILDPFNIEYETQSTTISDPTDAVGTFSFNLGIGAVVGIYDVYFWLNDTDAGAPDHSVLLTDTFRVENLEILVNLDKAPPAVYAPGESVRVEVTVRIDGERVAGAEVDIIVREEGNIQPQYGADNLITKTDGEVVHLFTLASTIPDGTSFEVEAVAQLQDVTISDIVTFTVEEVPVGEFRVSLKFDKSAYLSGDVITATAEVQTSGTTSGIIYRFWIYDWSSGDLLHWAIRTNNVLQYGVPFDFEGFLWFMVDAKNSEGFEDSDDEAVQVSYGYLLVDAFPKEYEAGDTITVSFQLVSNVIIYPTFHYTVEVGGLPIESGPAGPDSFTFNVPSVPASRYDFIVAAAGEGYVVEGEDTATLLAGFYMHLEFDKDSYLLGETITISYEITARGDSILPEVFYLSYGLMNGPQYYEQTASASGTLTYEVPSGINEGFQLFAVMETNTWAYAYESVWIGSGYPPWEAEISELEAEIISLQENLTLVQGILVEIWSQLNVTNATVGNYEDQIEDLEDRLTELEEKQTSTEDSLGANEAIAYAALLFGIVGLLLGIMAWIRKPPAARALAESEQPSSEESPASGEDPPA